MDNLVITIPQTVEVHFCSGRSIVFTGFYENDGGNIYITHKNGGLATINLAEVEFFTLRGAG